jgi:hypothetical protein
MRGYAGFLNYNSLYAAAYIFGSFVVLSAAVAVGAAKKLL